MKGFCRNIDLGISDFNFSSKNYNSKVYTCLENVVVLVTQSTTKLSMQFLDFSTILYRIYKFLLKRLRRVESICTLAPGTLNVRNYTLAFNTQAPKSQNLSQTGPRRRWRGRRRRCRPGAGKQTTREWDWPYPPSIGGGGSAEDVVDERRRQSHGGAAAEARTAVRIGAGLNNVRHG
jgi:hypothetical protein